MGKSKIRVKTRQQLACEYGIDRKTFYHWLKKSNLQLSKGLIRPSEIEKIYITFGDPNLPLLDSEG